VGDVTHGAGIRLFGWGQWAWAPTARGNFIFFFKKK